MVPISQLVVHVSNNFWVQLVGSDRSRFTMNRRQKGGKSWKVRIKWKRCNREKQAGQSRMKQSFFVFTPLADSTFSRDMNYWPSPLGSRLEKNGRNLCLAWARTAAAALNERLNGQDQTSCVLPLIKLSQEHRQEAAARAWARLHRRLSRGRPQIERNAGGLSVEDARV